MLGHRYHDLRSEALTSLCQLCLYMHRMFPPAQPWTKGPGANSPIHEDTQAVATLVFPFAIGGTLRNPQFKLKSLGSKQQVTGIQGLLGGQQATADAADNANCVSRERLATAGHAGDCGA